MPMPALSFGSVPGGRRFDEVADQIALHDGEPAALLEVGDRHAHRRAVDNVVGDHGAFETEFGIKRDLAEAAAGVADDLQVGSGVAAHGGESRVADTVAAHDDVVGAEHVDGVAVLAGAAGLVHDVFDAVVDDDRAVIAGLAAPDQDAAIAGTAHGIAGDAQPARIDREDRGISRIDRVPGDVAGDGLERDAVAAGIDNLAIGDAHGTALRQMQQPTPLRKRDAGAVEYEAADAEVVAAGGRHHRRSSGHDDACCPRDAGDGGEGRQL